MTVAELTVIERTAIEGLQLRFDMERKRHDAEIMEIIKQDKLISSFVSERLGLPSDAIGTTHMFDTSKWTVEEKPSDSEQEAVNEVQKAEG